MLSIFLSLLLTGERPAAMNKVREDKGTAIVFGYSELFLTCTCQAASSEDASSGGRAADKTSH
jgi:hypothetical protein